MTVNIYDVARVEFACGRADWLTQPFRAVIPRADYVPSFSAHTSASVLAPVRGAYCDLTGVAVDNGGWLQADPIFFASTPPNEDITQVAIYRVTDGMLFLHVTTPLLRATYSRPFVIVRGISRPGLCRL